MVKGKWMYLLAACMGAAVLIGVWQYMGREDGRKADKNSVRIGVLLYRGDDTFIGTLRTGLEDKAKEYEQETGIKVKLDIMDAKGSQNTQNSQVERLISLGCDALCINSVDRSSASIIIDKAMDAGTPVVFFNREPVEEDMNRWEKLYYVGADARRLLEEADVIVAKGQGNFETMHGCGLNVYYSFLCKCDWFQQRFGMEKNKGMFVRERSQ